MNSSTVQGPSVLLILDGWGRAPHQEKNPITLAKTPVIDDLWERYPHSVLEASGSAVGLLPDQDGNSEAGHLNIGAGRIVEQDVVKINSSIQNGTFFKNAAFEQAAYHAEQYHSRVHLMGLLSDEHSGHSNPDHIIGLLKFFRLKKISEVYLHLFTDGRDTEKYAALQLLQTLESELQPHEKVVTLMGRFYGMDRKKTWERTEIAYNTLTSEEHIVCFENTETALRDAYENGLSDEFITPRIICKKDEHAREPRIDHNDAIVFFNLRSDRARQLAKVFVQKNFETANPHSFTRKKILQNTVFVAMTDFGPDLENILTAYPSEDITGTLPMALKGLRQLYIAEGEKFAHITYFLNGGYAEPVAGEDRMLVPSPDVTSYDESPEMSTVAITDIILEKVKNHEYDFIGVNFANADMVGHTGNLEACIKAVRCIDQQIGRIVPAVLAKNGQVFITADHGNVEEIITSTGEADTEHSTNPVPFMIITNAPCENKRLTHGVLGHVAPTILHMMGRQKPNEMAYDSLI